MSTNASVEGDENENTEMFWLENRELCGDMKVDRKCKAAVEGWKRRKV